MITDNATIVGTLELIFKAGFIILSILYFIFSLIVIRQVNLMTQTLITEAAATLKAFSLLHALLSLGAVILFVLLL